jgi:hypothetical protein
VASGCSSDDRVIIDQWPVTSETGVTTDPDPTQPVEVPVTPTEPETSPAPVGPEVSRLVFVNGVGLDDITLGGRRGELLTSVVPERPQRRFTDATVRGNGQPGRRS